MERDPQLLRQADEINKIFADNITADISPQERSDHISHVIGNRGDINGEFIIHSYKRHSGDLDEFDVDPFLPPVEEYCSPKVEDLSEFVIETDVYEESPDGHYLQDIKVNKLGEPSRVIPDSGWHESGQKLVIKHPDNGEELTLIDFSYSPAEGGSLYTNNDVLKMVNPKDHFVTDFAEFPMIGEIFYECIEAGRTEADFISDREIMWLLRASSEWPFMEGLPETTTFQYSVLDGNVLFHVTSSQSLSDGTLRSISVSQLSAPTSAMLRLRSADSSTTEILQPHKPEEQAKALGIVKAGLHRLFS